MPSTPARRPAPDRHARIADVVGRISPAVLGSRLQRVRQRMGLSIRDVAERSGLSKTSVVRLEQGQACRPSTVARLCEVLGVHLERVAEAAPDPVAAVHRAADDRWVAMNDVAGPPSRRAQAAVATGAVAVNLLRSRLAHGRVLPTVLEVHAKSEVRRHPGEEFVYVLRGTLRLVVGTKTYTLKAGASACFWSGEPHHYAPAGRRPVRVLSVRVDG